MLYERGKEEIRVSHIMLRDPTKSKREVYKLAKSILDSLKKGKPFEELVQKYSNDPFSRPKGGDIYWFSVNQAIPEFEDAAFSTKVGEVYPEPVQTKYGTFIIKVTDRQKRRPKIRVAHILIDYKEGDKIDTLAAKEKG